MKEKGDEDQKKKMLGDYGVKVYTQRGTCQEGSSKPAWFIVGGGKESEIKGLCKV